jgi:hypothetical protein
MFLFSGDGRDVPETLPAVVVRRTEFPLAGIE